ncbi:MAG: hypothetical protein LBU99_05935, partial [Spirochaetaceae bacterium]|nr:hypothetical protein [Spirochaetaceae bacterium]
MSSYYYLMAQLPGLYQSASGTAALPFSYEYFTELCSRFLSSGDMERLNAVSLEPPREAARTGSALLDRWFEWERVLRFALAGIRAVRMKKERSSAEFNGAAQGI